MTSNPGVTSSINVERTQPKCRINMLQNPVINLLTRKRLHYIPFVLQLFSSATNNVMSPSGARKHVLLQSVRGKIHGGGGVVDAMVLFDTGLDCS